MSRMAIPSLYNYRDTEAVTKIVGEVSLHSGKHIFASRNMVIDPVAPSCCTVFFRIPNRLFHGLYRGQGAKQGHDP